jgi:hypothetical protein
VASDAHQAAPPSNPPIPAMFLSGEQGPPHGVRVGAEPVVEGVLDSQVPVAVERRQSQLNLHWRLARAEVGRLD